MKHIRQRNARMAEELILFAYKYGAEDINLNIKNTPEETIITIEATNVNLDKETIESITNLLNVPRCIEMEEYYWNLTGESDMDCELSLIGVMSDKVIINIASNILKIELIRKK